MIKRIIAAYRAWKRRELAYSLRNEYDALTAGIITCARRRVEIRDQLDALARAQ